MTSESIYHTVHLHCKEKPSHVLRVGARYDSERTAKIFSEFADENIFGSGNDLTFHVQYGGRDFRAFVDQEEEFDITTHNIAMYEEEHGLSVSDELKLQILQLQSLYQSIPSQNAADTVGILWQNGFLSPHDISRIGFTKFKAAAAGFLDLDEQDIKTLFNKATAAVYKTLAVRSAMSFGPIRPPIFVDVAPSSGEAYPYSGNANLGSLFGSQDSCHIEHCSSVFGPAEYLVDLLEYLKRTGGTTELGYDSGYDVLMACTVHNLMSLPAV